MQRELCHKILVFENLNSSQKLRASSTQVMYVAHRAVVTKAVDNVLPSDAVENVEVVDDVVALTRCLAKSQSLPSRNVSSSDCTKCQILPRSNISASNCLVGF